MKLEAIKNAQGSLFTDKPCTPISGGNVRSRRDALYERFSEKLELNSRLTRAVVSFQENKEEPFYRWLKFKEGFSSRLVMYFLNDLKQSRKPLRVLDPFAGSGTTLTTSIQQGHYAVGIELLPVGIAAMHARLMADAVDIARFRRHFEQLKTVRFDTLPMGRYNFPHLRITEGAFSEETEADISRYMAFVDSIEDEKVHYLFWFACLSVLEEVSYTSKDGQYLRWDCRAKRRLRSKYRKKQILPFRQAILQKLQLMLNDLKKRNGGTFSQNVQIIEGSCLEELPKMEADSIDLVVTSPPYCNRYDYTRTYALELAFLGYSEEKVKRLRQTLLSATVENKPKKEELRAKYETWRRTDFFEHVWQTFQSQEALHEVLELLREAREQRQLNNSNIPTMVENYFFEMNFIIHELARVLSPGGRVYMVNDNVQYNGEEVPVDLILSDFAQAAGLDVERIWVLPRGKGNSSQQMGKFGRTEIRKCVYVWSKPGNKLFFTKELERRIREDRLVEKAFDIIDLLENPTVRETFFREIFHHTLRLT